MPPSVNPIIDKEYKLSIDQFLEIGPGHFDVHLDRLCESDCSLGSIFLHAKLLLLPKARLLEVGGCVVYVLGKWRYGGCGPICPKSEFQVGRQRAFFWSRNP